MWSRCRELLRQFHQGPCKGEPRTCAIFILAWGSNWGSLGVFRNQNNCGSSNVYVTCFYCILNMKIICLKRRTAQEDCGRICFAFVFCVCGQQNPNTPNLSPMADDAITWGGILGLGSPLYICVKVRVHSCLQPNLCQRLKSLFCPQLWEGGVPNGRKMLFNKGSAWHGTHPYTHDFGPPLGFLFRMTRYREKLQKTLELSIYFIEEIKI